jgi:phage tail-like protein
MHDTGKNNYFYLNRDGVWPDFQRSGLELDEDGTLRLASLPRFSGELPAGLDALPAPDGPGGLAMDRSGTLYWSDSAGNTIMRISGCDGQAGAVSCVGGEGSQPAQFKTPRGLLVPENRNALFVVDSGNDRIQIFDLETFQLVEIWGNSGSAPGQFSNPWTLAGDPAGNIYVVDYGNQRVQKFTSLGNVVPGFWQNMHDSGLLHQPSDVAVLQHRGKTWIIVVDAAADEIFVFDHNGNPIPGFSQPLPFAAPMGIAAAGDALYVGSNDAKTILRFQIGNNFEFIGEAIGYHGPVAALLLDSHHNLWVQPGGSIKPLQLQAETGYGLQGTLFRGPIQVGDRKVVWHRLQALLAPLPPNAHLDVFAYAADKLTDAPPPPAADDPFSDPKWQSVDYAAGFDVADLYIGGHEARYLWVGVLFSGDGTATPALRQLRVEFDHAGYERFLPAIYQKETGCKKPICNQKDCSDFLVRLLSLFESLYAGTEWEIASLPTLFDPKAAPQQFLAWLAGCLGLDVDQNWSDEEERRIIARIFHFFGLRGTVAGLREALRLFAGVDVVIEEPLLNASWWALPAPEESCCESCSTACGPSWQGTENSRLGWTTMLAPSQPQGAVVGTSADLDQSQLITDADFGEPLFSDVAYQFNVQVYRSQLTRANAMARIQAVIEQEKPAHTAYQLCVIEPRFRVGYQGRVGIDTVVGGQSRSLSLGSGQALGEETILAGAAASRMGVESRLGLNTRLT